jgi:hypothetical protein
VYHGVVLASLVHSYLKVSDSYKKAMRFQLPSEFSLQIAQEGSNIFIPVEKHNKINSSYLALRGLQSCYKTLRFRIAHLEEINLRALVSRPTVGFVAHIATLMSSYTVGSVTAPWHYKKFFDW